MSGDIDAIFEKRKRPEREAYDIVVVGGGAAGLSAAKITARSRRSVPVIDAGNPRNAPAEGVHNYLYAEGKAPWELTAIGRGEAVGYGVEILLGAATSARVIVDPTAGAPRFGLTIDGGRTVAARRLLLATGLVDELPTIPGLVERWGKDVLHCPFCRSWEIRDRALGVVDRADGGLSDAAVPGVERGCGAVHPYRSAAHGRAA